MAWAHKLRYTRIEVLSSYLPAIVLLLIGIGFGTLFALLNHMLRPRRPTKAKTDPYECGQPSEIRKRFRFGIRAPPRVS